MGGELEAVPVPREGSGEGKGRNKSRVVDGPTLDKERKAYTLTQNVVKRAPAKMNWERVDVLECIDLGKYLDSERFGVLQVKGCEFLS